MDFKTMTLEELEARKAEISTECEAEGADVDALLEEVRAINAELEERRLAAEAAAKQAEIRAAVAAGAGIVITAPKQEEERKMDLNEIRKSDAYVKAFANYIKTEDDSECRALLSENGTNGTVPVPEVVYDIVKNAWERDGITSRVRKTYLRGNLKVGFEISSDGAVIHTEGGNAINPENLVLGIVELVPQSIKKVVQVSDEALDLSGEAFLQYIYDEVTYQIAKKAADTLLAKIAALSTTATTTAVNVGAITATSASVGLVAQALAELSDQAANPCVVLNRSTWGAFKAAQAANSFNYDPFEGLPVVFNNSLKSVSAASTGDTWMIVGDFGEGAIMNFPNGEEINIVIDRLSLKKQDLVEVFGREFVGIGVVGPKSFCKVSK